MSFRFSTKFLGSPTKFKHSSICNTGQVFHLSGFYENHINNSSEMPSPSVWHIHGRSIHFDFFLWIQELPRKHLLTTPGKAEQWRGVGISCLPSTAARGGRSLEEQSPLRPSGLVRIVHLQASPGSSSCTGWVTQCWEFLRGFVKPQNLTPPLSVSDSGGPREARESAFLTNSHVMLWLLITWLHIYPINM